MAGRARYGAAAALRSGRGIVISHHPHRAGGRAGTWTDSSDTPAAWKLGQRHDDTFLQHIAQMLCRHGYSLLQSRATRGGCVNVGLSLQIVGNCTEWCAKKDKRY